MRCELIKINTTVAVAAVVATAIFLRSRAYEHSSVVIETACLFLPFSSSREKYNLRNKFFDNTYPCIFSRPKCFFSLFRSGVFCFKSKECSIDTIGIGIGIGFASYDSIKNGGPEKEGVLVFPN